MLINQLNEVSTKLKKETTDTLVRLERLMIPRETKKG
jgi:hypothetical protein